MKYIYFPSLFLVSLCWTMLITGSCTEECAVEPEIVLDQNTWILNRYYGFDDGTENYDLLYIYELVPENNQSLINFAFDRAPGNYPFFDIGQEFEMTNDSSEAFTTTLVFIQRCQFGEDVRCYEQQPQYYKGAFNPHNESRLACEKMVKLDGLYGFEPLYLTLKN